MYQFILNIIHQNPDIFINLRKLPDHEMVQNFFSLYACFDFNHGPLANNSQLHYTFLSYHPNVSKLADGLFFTSSNCDLIRPKNINSTIWNNVMPIQYKYKMPDTIKDLTAGYSIKDIAEKALMDYTNTSSIIQVGIENANLLNNANLDGIAEKIWIQDYSLPVSEQFKNKVNFMVDYMRSKKNENSDLYNNSNILYKNILNEYYQFNYNTINIDNNIYISEGTNLIEYLKNLDKTL